MKPKKLTLREVHSLYMILKHALPVNEEELLIDEFDGILDKAIPGTIAQCLEVMYSIKYLRKQSTLILSLLFIRGLRENNFFDYVNFINGINGRDIRKNPN